MVEIKRQARKVLGRMGLLTRAEFAWRSLQRGGRKVNAGLRRTERKNLALYGPLVRPGELCFDVGANYGWYTESFLKLGLRVVAVEPQAVCIDYLRAKFGRDRRVQIVAAGLAEAEGQREFMISDRSATSSMSPEWMGQILSRGGKFASIRWDQKVIVPVTTCDTLIAQYGMPALIKIDVEGYEYHVLRGLTQPVRALSFEYTPELIQPALDCVDYLENLGAGAGGYEFNHARGDANEFALADWVDAAHMKRILNDIAQTHASGDVYARLRGSGGR